MHSPTLEGVLYCAYIIFYTLSLKCHSLQSDDPFAFRSQFCKRRHLTRGFRPAKQGARRLFLSQRHDKVQGFCEGTEFVILSSLAGLACTNILGHVAKTMRPAAPRSMPARISKRQPSNHAAIALRSSTTGSKTSFTTHTNNYAAHAL